MADEFSTITGSRERGRRHCPAIDIQMALVLFIDMSSLDT